MIWVHYTTWGLWHNWGEMLRKLTSRLEQVAWSDVCAGEYWVCIILRWARLSWSLETVSFKTDEMLVSALNLWVWLIIWRCKWLANAIMLWLGWQDIADGTLMLRGCEGMSCMWAYETLSVVLITEHGIKWYCCAEGGRRVWGKWDVCELGVVCGIHHRTRNKKLCDGESCNTPSQL